MAMVRAFICIELAEKSRKILEDFQTELKQINADVRWVRPAGIHLTLKFLGDVDVERIDQIEEAIKKSVTDLVPFKLELSGTGTFPNFKHPRVFWVGVAGQVDVLSALAQQIDNNLNAIGFDKEEREFSPHLTLGRVKSTFGIKSVTNVVSNKILEKNEFLVKEIVLMQSELKATGAEYSSLRKIQL